MEETRIFIRRDTNAEATFMKGLNNAVYKGNKLIELFNESQPFKKIENEQELASLLSDPLGYYDSVLLANIQHDTKLTPNMVYLASLYTIPRVEYLTGLGIPLGIAERTYSPGGKESKSNILRSSTLSTNEYKEYSPYINFSEGRLNIRQTVIEESKDKFNVYAETEAQKKLYLHYKDLAETLNYAIKYHKLSQTHIQELAGMFDLLVLNDRLMINDIKLSEQIKYI